MSPGAVISVLPGWSPSQPLPCRPAAASAGTALSLGGRSGLVLQLALGLQGGGHFVFHLNCCAGRLHPSPSPCCRWWPPLTTPSVLQAPFQQAPTKVGRRAGAPLWLQPRAGACCLSPALGPGSGGAAGRSHLRIVNIPGPGLPLLTLLPLRPARCRCVRQGWGTLSSSGSPALPGWGAGASLGNREPARLSFVTPAVELTACPIRPGLRQMAAAVPSLGRAPSAPHPRSACSPSVPAEGR